MKEFSASARASFASHRTFVDTVDGKFEIPLISENLIDAQGFWVLLPGTVERSTVVFDASPAFYYTGLSRKPSLTLFHFLCTGRNTGAELDSVLSGIWTGENSFPNIIDVSWFWPMPSDGFWVVPGMAAGSSTFNMLDAESVRPGGLRAAVQVERIRQLAIGRATATEDSLELLLNLAAWRV